MLNIIVDIQQKKSILDWDALKKDWRRPTFPQTSAVSSAM